MSDSEEDLSHFTERGENFLEHYGVKGMKWGVVRTNKTTAIKNSRASNRATRRQIRETSDKATKKELKKAYKTSPERVAGRQLATGEKAVVSVLGTYGAMKAVNWTYDNFIAPFGALALAGAQTSVSVLEAQAQAQKD